jgi:hypothetical protein
MTDSVDCRDERAGEKTPDFVEGGAYQRRLGQQSILSLTAVAVVSPANRTRDRHGARRICSTTVSGTRILY